MGILMLKKLGPVKIYGGPVKLGISMWLPVLRSGKGPKFFPMSELWGIFCECKVFIHFILATAGKKLLSLNQFKKKKIATEGTPQLTPKSKV